MQFCVAKNYSDIIIKKRDGKHCTSNLTKTIIYKITVCIILKGRKINHLQSHEEARPQPPAALPSGRLPLLFSRRNERIHFADILILKLTDIFNRFHNIFGFSFLKYMAFRVKH